MQFYPADYLTDTLPLSLPARGAWMDLICFLWRAEKRGALVLHESKLARMLRCTLPALRQVLAELSEFHICDTVTNGNGEVTLRCRRMLREEKARQSTKIRVRRYRVTHACNVPVQECNRENQNHTSESEVRNQNQKSDEERDKKEKTVGEVRDLARPPKSDACWQRYRASYVEVWKVEPVRNKRTNSDLCGLVDRLGNEIAPEVAGFYPHHQRQLYMAARHPTNLLLRDCEGIRVDMLKGHDDSSIPTKPRSMVELIG